MDLHFLLGSFKSSPQCKVKLMFGFLNVLGKNYFQTKKRFESYEFF